MSIGVLHVWPHEGLSIYNSSRTEYMAMRLLDLACPDSGINQSDRLHMC